MTIQLISHSKRIYIHVSEAPNYPAKTMKLA